MPREQDKFQNAVSSVLETVMFESWLRFCFIMQKEDGDEDDLWLLVPEKALAKIGEMYPHLLPLARDLAGRKISFETSQQAICNFVSQSIDGDRSLPSTINAAVVLDSMTFQLKLNLFHTWLELHEDQLEAEFHDFSAWQTLFAQWQESPAARKLADQLALAAQHPAQTGTDATGESAKN